MTDLFYSGLETNDFSEWDATQLSGSYLTITSLPVYKGSYSGKMVGDLWYEPFAQDNNSVPAVFPYWVTGKIRISSLIINSGTWTVEFLGVGDSACWGGVGCGGVALAVRATATTWKIGLWDVYNFTFYEHDDLLFDVWYNITLKIESNKATLYIGSSEVATFTDANIGNYDTVFSAIGNESARDSASVVYVGEPLYTSTPFALNTVS